MPAEVSLTTFTKFGVEFGIFICFDIAFPTPAIDLVKSGVKHFVFSVAVNFFILFSFSFKKQKFLTPFFFKKKF